MLWLFWPVCVYKPVLRVCPFVRVCLYPNFPPYVVVRTVGSLVLCAFPVPPPVLWLSLLCVSAGRRPSTHWQCVSQKQRHVVACLSVCINSSTGRLFVGRRLALSNSTTGT